MKRFVCFLGIGLEQKIEDGESQAKNEPNVGLGLLIIMVLAGLLLFIPAVMFGLEPPG